MVALTCSICYWFNLPSVSLLQSQFSIGDSAASRASLWLGVNAANYPYASMAGQQTITGFVSIKSSQWYQYCFTMLSKSKRGVLSSYASIFIDGQYLASDSGGSLFED